MELRQSMGKVLADLQRTGKPILLEKGHKPVGVIVSLKDYHERFVERVAAEERDLIVAEMDALARPSVDSTSSVEVLRELRGGG